MGHYVVYREKEYVKYFNFIFSRATIFVFIFSVTPLFVSLIAAYRAYGFYTTSVFITNQPVVNLQQDMVLSFLTQSGGVYSWSTIQSTTPNCIPTISIREIDANYDGIKESIKMNVKLYKSNISGIKFLLQFDYNVTSSISTLRIQQPIVIFVDALQASQKVVISGRLDVYQKRRLPNSGTLLIYNNAYYNSSSSAAVLANPFDNLAQFDSARNFTVKLKDVFTAWQVTPIPSIIEVDIEIFFNPVELQYHAEFWSMIKWAWVQWFYFLVMFMFVFQRSKEFIFDSFTMSASKRSTQLHKCEDATQLTTKF